MAVLRESVEKRKQYIIDFLIDHEVYEAPDGQQLYELPLAELERMYITLRCEIGREISRIEREEE
jgi:Fur-regulated basic protein A